MSSDWTYHASLNTNDSLVFFHAIEHQTDYTYKPLVVAKQITTGINYRYICIATPKDATGMSHFSMVAIHKPFNEAGYVVAIHPIDCHL